MTETAVVDALDQTFELGEHYGRLVSLVPSLTESLFDLGVGERVVGRTAYCTYPRDRVAAVPTVGGPKSPDLEAILALHPDLILMDQEENRYADAQALITRGARVFASAPRSVLDTFNLLWDLVNVLGVTTQAGPRIQTIERVYDWTRDATAALDATVAVRLFCPVWRDPWMTFNADTYAHDLLSICGGENVFGLADTRYPPITLEQVAEQEPELILLPSEPFAFNPADVDAFKAHPTLVQTPVRLVDGSLLFWPGTRLARALDQLPPLLQS